MRLTLFDSARSPGRSRSSFTRLPTFRMCNNPDRRTGVLLPRRCPAYRFVIAAVRTSPIAMPQVAFDQSRAARILLASCSKRRQSFRQSPRISGSTLWSPTAIASALAHLTAASKLSSEGLSTRRLSMVPVLGLRCSSTLQLGPSEGRRANGLRTHRSAVLSESVPI